ncbi:Protein of unknown function DUF3339 [Cynara cardunculus var. scolymus]|uniref:Uncharacterized protein n=1 Tax=Cynara cardunculus var. scolymus TaxID=59895 RepID=A0A103Y4J5_CYNCS|nr:Protein of unknown function DUF3339 [Cynara cardunculus var. scolymus]
MFILLSPGLLFQMPARTRIIEFGNMYTSCIAILIHALLYFCIFTILVVTIENTIIQFGLGGGGGGGGVGEKVEVRLQVLDDGGVEGGGGGDEG